MSPQEFEQALHDAEVKLARLKALYEQWFQGIEKLEPTVPRKDLDRFLDILKRNVPRNTALRFRMQQLVARYGTYVIYWQRVARQIEEGTLHRDIVKARRKQMQQTQKRQEQQAFELDVDVDVEMDDLLADEPAKPPPSTVVPRVAPRTSDLDAILGTLAPPADDPNKARSARPLSPFAMARAAPAASATFGKPKDKPASAAATVVLPSAPSTTPVPAPVSVVAPKPVVPPKPVVAPPKPIIAPPIAAPTAAIPKPVAPPPVAAPPAAPIARAVVPAPSAPRPMAPAVPRPAPPIAPPPVAAPKPAAPVAAARPSGDLDDGQMRAIYSRYVDARKKNNERADVRYEALAESVQKMMPKLREKHAGKPIDFEIVLQNGKVGLKPKVGG